MTHLGSGLGSAAPRLAPRLLAPLATLVLLPLLGAAPGCKGCRDDEAEEAEERNLRRDHFWRAQISLSGKGTVRTFVPAFDCTSDGTSQSGDCGPKLLRFKELAPPTMEAVAAEGWRFDRWEAEIRSPDGGVRPRNGPMPDGRVYLDGFGYTDTGELETVRAVFVPAPGGG